MPRTILMPTEVFCEVVKNITWNSLELADAGGIWTNRSQLSQALVVGSHRLNVRQTCVGYTGRHHLQPASLTLQQLQFYRRPLYTGVSIKICNMQSIFTCTESSFSRLYCLKFAFKLLNVSFYELCKKNKGLQFLVGVVLLCTVAINKCNCIQYNIGPQVRYMIRYDTTTWNQTESLNKKQNKNKPKLKITDN